MRRDITTQQRLYLSLKVRIRLYQNISQSVTYVLTTKIRHHTFGVSFLDFKPVNIYNYEDTHG